ncbi:hypothetical protein ACWEKM_14080 [Streptomyces sp. NPDC004752]
MTTVIPGARTPDRPARAHAAEPPSVPVRAGPRRDPGPARPPDHDHRMKAQVEDLEDRW